MMKNYHKLCSFNHGSVDQKNLSVQRSCSLGSFYFLTLWIEVNSRVFFSRKFLLFFVFLYHSLLNAQQVIFDDNYSPTSGLFKVQFSYDARKLALFTVSEDIKLVSLKYQQEIAALDNRGEISDVDLSGSGHVLLISDYQKHWSDFRYYELSKSSPIMDFRINEPLRDAKVSFDGRYLLAVKNSRILQIYDVAQTISVSEVEVGSDITSYSFSWDLRWILIGTMTGDFHLWDTKLGVMVLEDNFGESVHLTKLGSSFALITGRFQDDLIIDLRTKEQIRLKNPMNKSKRLPSQVISAAFHPILRSTLALARPAHFVEIWDLNDQTLKHKLSVKGPMSSRFHRSTPLGIAWDREGILWGMTAQGEVFHWKAGE